MRRPFAKAGGPGYSYPQRLSIGIFSVRNNLGDLIINRDFAVKAHKSFAFIDGQIGQTEGDGKLRPEAIADSYWHLHRQPRSAWTQELDIRPWAEKY